LFSLGHEDEFIKESEDLDGGLVDGAADGAVLVGQIPDGGHDFVGDIRVLFLKGEGGREGGREGGWVSEWMERQMVRFSSERFRTAAMTS